jgi:hypothetical protein
MKGADEFMPIYQFSEGHEIRIEAPPRFILRAIDDLRRDDDPLIRALIAIREAPARFARALGLASISRTEPPFGMQRFVKLRQTNDRAIYGLIGRFWRPDFGLEKVTSPDGFLAFEQAGVAKLVMSFCLSADDAGSALLTTETRIFCADRRSLLLFWVYWLAIRAPSGLIRRRMLAAVKRKAESEMKRDWPS